MSICRGAGSWNVPTSQKEAARNHGRTERRKKSNKQPPVTRGWTPFYCHRYFSSFDRQNTTYYSCVFRIREAEAEGCDESEAKKKIKVCTESGLRIKTFQILTTTHMSIYVGRKRVLLQRSIVLVTFIFH